MGPEYMAKPQGKVKIKWSPQFAYAIGLLTTDGNLSPSGRHFDFTSADREQILNFMKCLGIKNKITRKKGPFSKKIVLRIQFGDIIFYKFLLKIGLMPRKSKILGKVKIPNKYFFDFLRGHLDGDGTFHSYWDPRWRSSFMFYTIVVSASQNHILWLQGKVFKFLKIKGHVTKSQNDSVYQLKYAKADSLKLLPKIYYSKGVVCLTRKKLKIIKALAIIGRKLFNEV